MTYCFLTLAYRFAHRLRSLVRHLLRPAVPQWGLMMCLLAATPNAWAQTEAEWEALKGDVRCFVLNDMGRNGYYDQKPIAELAGRMADVIGPDCIVATGDVHHFDGVASVNDPLWLTNFELIYSHPELMIAWYPVLGNHEYRGCTQAVLDYTKVSRRWCMPSRYYTRVLTDKKAGVSLRLVLLDTTPLIDSYRAANQKYPDACRQDPDAQVAWLDSVLTVANEDWVVVMGHHPVYAQTTKGERERIDMQNRLLPVFARHPRKVAMYVSGHIHNFQHVHRAEGGDVDYVVNSAASLSRKVQPIEGTVFCSPEPGFSVLSATKQGVTLHMIDREGRVLHTVTHTRH